MLFRSEREGQRSERKLEEQHQRLSAALEQERASTEGKVKEAVEAAAREHKVMMGLLPSLLSCILCPSSSCSSSSSLSSLCSSSLCLPLPPFLPPSFPLLPFLSPSVSFCSHHMTLTRLSHDDHCLPLPRSYWRRPYKRPWPATSPPCRRHCK